MFKMFRVIINFDFVYFWTIHRVLINYSIRVISCYIEKKLLTSISNFSIINKVSQVYVIMRNSKIVLKFKRILFVKNRGSISVGHLQRMTHKFDKIINYRAIFESRVNYNFVLCVIFPSQCNKVRDTINVIEGAARL